MVSNGAPTNTHRRRQWYGSIVNHLARREMFQCGVRFGIHLHSCLTLNKAVLGWNILITCAMRVLTCLATKIVLKIDHISANMGNGCATDDAEFHTTSIAMHIARVIHDVGQWRDTLR